MPNAIGWLVVCFPEPEKNTDWFEPLSFGRPDEPHPEMLLRRRRFMAFETHEEAEAALRETGKMAAEQNVQWLRRFAFKVMPVEMHVSNEEPE